VNPVLASLIIGVVVFAFDLAMPLGVAAGVPYVAMVLMGTWMPRTRHVVLLAVISTVLVVAGYIFSPSGGVLWVTIANRILALVVIWVTTLLVASRKTIRIERDRSNRELEFQKLALDEHAIVSITDAAGDIVYVNDKFCLSSGYTREELIGQNHRKLKSGTHSEAFYRGMWETVAAGRIWNGEVVNSSKDGQYHYFSATIVPLMNEQGQPYQYAAIRTDITHQKLIEQELERREQELRLVTDNLPVLITYIDKDQRLRFANKTAIEWYQRNLDEILGETVEDIFGSDIYGTFEEHIHQALAGNEVQFENHVVYPGANERFVDVAYVPHFSDQREVEGYFVLAQDVSARRETERELSSSQLTISGLLESTQQGYWQIDNEALSVEVNDAMCRIMGRTKEDVLGRPIYDFVDEENTRVFHRQIERRLQGEKGAYEIMIMQPDGTNIPCINTATPIFDDQGNKIGSVGLYTVISDLKSAVEKADLANKAKSEFLSSMSHELRTPLNAVIGFSTLLKNDRDHPLAEDQSDSVDQIQIAGQHLLNLVNEVLDLSRIEMDELEMTIGEVDLQHMLDECVDLIGAQAEALAIEVVFEKPEAIMLMADQSRLRQAILNLMSNAVKYNREGGRINVSSGAANDGFAWIRIEDTGDGIPADDLDGLFQPFNRLGRENSAIEGTGVGLAITKKLVEAMNGRIEVETEIGKGSVFTIQLPQSGIVNSETRASRRLLPDPLAQLDTGPDSVSFEATVLYIEDNESNRLLVKKIMKRMPLCRLKMAEDAETGLRLARELKPDIILMDINLPGMGGIAALNELKKDETTASIQVIAVSANAMQADIDKAMEAGFYRYLTKPLLVDEFLQTISEALSGNL
jgi:PAS domain S-box-containing protein